MLDNIEFEYADNVLPSALREIKATEEANRVLEPFIEKINEANARVRIWFPAKGPNHYYFDNLPLDLEAMIYRNFPILPRISNDDKEGLENNLYP